MKWYLIDMFIMQCDISYISNHTTCSVVQTEAALRSELEELRNKESVMLFMREKERKVSYLFNVPIHFFYRLCMSFIFL